MRIVVVSRMAPKSKGKKRGVEEVELDEEELMDSIDARIAKRFEEREKELAKREQALESKIRRDLLPVNLQGVINSMPPTVGRTDAAYLEAVARTMLSGPLSGLASVSPLPLAYENKREK